MCDQYLQEHFEVVSWKEKADDRKKADAELVQAREVQAKTTAVNNRMQNAMDSIKSQVHTILEAEDAEKFCIVAVFNFDMDKLSDHDPVHQDILSEQEELNHLVTTFDMCDGQRVQRDLIWQTADKPNQAAIQEKKKAAWKVQQVRPASGGGGPPGGTANRRASCAQSELISTITASAEKEKEIAKEEREVERQERALDRAAEASRHQRQMEVQEMEIKLRREEMQARIAQEARNHELMMKVLGSVLPGINPST